MACREKWIITWKNPKTGRVKTKTLYNEDKAVKFILRKVQQGMIVSDDFYPCEEE